MKTTFTKEQEQSLNTLILKSVRDNDFFTNPLGVAVSVQELLHNTSVNTVLKMIEKEGSTIEFLKRKVELNLLAEEVVADEVAIQDDLKLILAYKLYEQELQDLAVKKAKLQKELELLKDSIKTPQDKIAELEAALAEME